MLVIGSTAIKHYYPDFTREPKDLDYAVDESCKLESRRGLEYLYNPIILKYQKDGYLEPSLLLTLKMSHMFWDNQWKKHMYDIQFLFDKDLDYHPTLLEELIEHWMKTKDKVHRSFLATTKEDFFTNAVNEDVDEHDHLHTLINPVPMFTRILKDGAEVELDENKWNNLSHKDKLEVVREETYVMAYERYNGRMHYVMAYIRQLKDNIIKHFPRYIAIFAIINYVELLVPKIKYHKILDNE